MRIFALLIVVTLVVGVFFLASSPPNGALPNGALPNGEILTGLLPEALPTKPTKRTRATDGGTKPPEFFFVPHRTKSKAVQNVSEKIVPNFASTVPQTKAATTARSYLRQYASRYRLNPDTLSGARLRYVHDTGSGPMIAKFNQYVDDIEVFRNEMNVMTDRDGTLVAISGHLSPHVAVLEKEGAAHFQHQVDHLKKQFLFPPEMAIANAFKTMGGTDNGEAWSLLHTQGGYAFYAGPLSQGDYRPREPARLKRVFFDAEDGLKPAYYIELVAGAFDSVVDDAYSHVVSAVDGRVLFRKNLVSSVAFSYRVYADTTGEHLPMDSPMGNSGTPNPLGVLTTPIWFPESVSQNKITLQNGPIQNGDPWLSPQATTTRGNNADVYMDLSAPNGYQASRGDLRATVNGERTFDYPYDPMLDAMATSAQNQAAIVQLFYTVNFLHDWFYDVGFDEASGNAQQDNYGRGGQAGDPLLAEAQDYSDRDNARMTVFADGASPRMEMFLWNGIADIRVTLNQPATIGALLAGRAAFGPRAFQLSGNLVRMDDGVEPIRDGCAAARYPAPLVGKIVMIDRGTCFFVDKVRYAQAAGAIGVLVVNHEDDAFTLTMSGEGEDITIPSLFILKKDGQLLDAALMAGPVQLTLSRSQAKDLSGAMDALIVAHEWGHLISNRLIGDANGLYNGQGESLGEGWSDFHALLLAVRAEDAQVSSNDIFQGTYAIGSYVSSFSQEGDPYYFGLRRVPYSTHLDKNALTFKHIEDGVPLPDSHPRHNTDSENAAPHAAGEVWASMLWEVYAALLRDTERLTFAQAQKRMMAYLVASYKMTPLDPTFTEARDALLAVAMTDDPKDYLLMQEAFARRGLGSQARSPDRYSMDNFGVKESFTVDSPWRVENAILDPSVISCDQDKVLDVGETARLTLILRHDGPVPLPSTRATLTTGNAVRFSENGMIHLPDAEPGETVQVSIELTLDAANHGEIVQIDMTPDDKWAGSQKTVWTGHVNMDLKPAFTQDSVEKSLTDWTMGRGLEEEGEGVTWEIRDLEGGGQGYWGEDPDHPTDFWLESPPIQVAERGSSRFQFDHAYAFEEDEEGTWDGGVLELRVGTHGAWQDLGAFMKSGYNGTLLDSNPVLGGRAAFVGSSPGYPAFITETVVLGEVYHGQEVTIRFRIGSDQYVGHAGWMIRNIRFENIDNLPFTAMVDNAVSCGVPSTPEEDMPGFHSVDGVLRGLAAGDRVRITAYAPSIAHQASVDLLGHGGDRAFTLRKLPSAPDYQLLVTADKYQDGYWGGVSGEVPVHVVPVFRAAVLDLSQEGMRGINLQLALQHTLRVTLDGVREGDVLDVTAWSEHSGGLAWQKVIVQGGVAQVVLPGLPEAGDYLLSVTSYADDLMSGFYTGENRVVGPFLQAERLLMDGDRAITLKMATGRRITGRVGYGDGYREDVRAWVSAWSEERWSGAVTDMDAVGGYHLTGLAPARDYRVCVTSERLAGGCYGGNMTVPYRLAIPVDVTAGDKMDIDLTMADGHRIIGLVTGLAEGDTAWVEVWSTENGHWATAQVGVDGTFSLEGLPRANDYQVTLMAPSYQTQSLKKVEVGGRASSVLADGTTVTSVHFNSVRGGRIEGTIHGLRRQDVVTVSVRSLALGKSRDVTVLAKDAEPLAYALDGLADAQDYVLSLQTPQGLFFLGRNGVVRHWRDRMEWAIVSGATVSAVDFMLGAEASYALSGRINGLQAGDENLLLTVTAWSEAGDLGSTRRVGDGDWLITGLGRGDYRILVQAPGYVGQFFAGFTGNTPLWHASWKEAKVLSVQADVRGLDVTLLAGHAITGRVADANNTPLAEVRVNVWDSSQDLGGGVMTLADGRFRMAGMADGRYQLEINSDQGDYQTHFDSLTVDRELGTLTLLKQTGSVGGIVTGVGAAQALVLVYTADGTYVTATVTDGNGFYYVDNLPTGKHYRLDVDTNNDFSVMEGTAMVEVNGSVIANMDLPVVVQR